jgi:hypothetical protein
MSVKVRMIDACDREDLHRKLAAPSPTLIEAAVWRGRAGLIEDQA